MSSLPITGLAPIRPGLPSRGSTAPAEALEAAFLEQMLTPMGLRAREGTLSGGAGESQFHSFLQQQYARLLSERIDLRLEGAKQ
ncbi:flagellar biosynthesis protein FlgJ [Paracoccus sp. S-4012]|uniref:flagellar biosynthesis protein FlgJ n=1 Tax=Paracoccus sp. S-4012 TaxID=2665648 RepID=UPI0012AFA390|nr:flagellar biosynthesis protein FlgJ [Paracoccus sp. S-4012]MRX49021.1 flagellar biosynthesis protein FlgJ [Paracoccus sp. S-4012]